VSDYSCVAELLNAPELKSVVASSPAVRESLQGLLNQVHDEIAMLEPLLDRQDSCDRERLAAAIAGRRTIVERLTTLLVGCGTFVA
jgi:hypothetical protein